MCITSLYSLTEMLAVCTLQVSPYISTSPSSYVPVPPLPNSGVKICVAKGCSWCPTGYVYDKCASSAAFYNQPFCNQVAVCRSMTSSTFLTSRRRKPEHNRLHPHIPHPPIGLLSTPCHLPTSLNNCLVCHPSISLKTLATV
jgi:hypothetical protein